MRGAAGLQVALTVRIATLQRRIEAQERQLAILRNLAQVLLLRHWYLRAR